MKFRIEPATKFKLLWIAMHGIPLETEFRFHEARKFRFDFAHPMTKIAFEIEGGTWSGGRHTRGAGYQKDCEKYNLAALCGWTVFRFTTTMINSGNLKPFVEHLRERSNMMAMVNLGRAMAAER